MLIIQLLFKKNLIFKICKQVVVPQGNKVLNKLMLRKEVLVILLKNIRMLIKLMDFLKKGKIVAVISILLVEIHRKILLLEVKLEGY